ncbi:hypothetical protein JW851_02590 [Candidatus Woesearchaeota archaeon]|nr:hypothetical protein [Candidatus Woesearchaeota archaeon]
MEIKYSETIEFERELSKLDKIVIDFSQILNKLNIKYVFVSGYVSILFGRNRTSEDVDLIIEKINFEKFQKLWKELYSKFECLNTEDVKEAYEKYLLDNISIRFARKKLYVPNIEIKFPHIELNECDAIALNERKKVILNKNIFYISPIELQIAFKLFLGSEKDIEDARYLYKLFKKELNKEILTQFCQKLKIVEVSDRYLK